MDTRSTRRWGGGGSGGGSGCGAGNAVSGRAAAVGEHPSAGPSEESDHADADAPSELLGPLLEEWREVLVKHVLAGLNATDCALLARVGRPWLAVVLAHKLPRAGKDGAVALKISRLASDILRTMPLCGTGSYSSSAPL